MSAALLAVSYAVLSRGRFFATLWTIACQAPLSLGFSRQEYWSRLPFPPPEYLPNPGIEPMSLPFPALAGGFFITAPPGKLYKYVNYRINIVGIP